MDNSALDRVSLPTVGPKLTKGRLNWPGSMASISWMAREIISTDHSFHGRTLTTVAATGKVAYQKDFVRSRLALLSFPTTILMHCEGHYR